MTLRIDDFDFLDSLDPELRTVARGLVQKAVDDSVRHERRFESIHSTLLWGINQGLDHGPVGSSLDLVRAAEDAFRKEDEDNGAVS